jgi:predicted metal-dependent HD superfamily phosphohydrolase
MLKHGFFELTQKYSNDPQYIESLWTEISTHYTNKNRHYHNLDHLDNLYHQLLDVKPEIEDWDSILFSLFYHDIIYNVRKNDNEAKSAEVAQARLSKTAFPPDRISRVVRHIRATQGHQISDDPDTNLFTDADLSVLGQDWETCTRYCAGIRKEYAFYPDLLYSAGRKKVLHHFLGMNRIYKTDYFFEKYETAARENLNKELIML